MVFQGVLNILQYPYGHASPLAALRAFEATIRLGGLARAAIELNLTTSAISHQSHTGRRETIVRRRRRPVAAGGRRDWHRHGQAFTVEVLEELGLPREISVAPATGTTDREVPVDAHAPHVVGNSASEWFDASCVSPHCPSAFHPAGDIFRDTVGIRLRSGCPDINSLFIISEWFETILKHVEGMANYEQASVEMTVAFLDPLPRFVFLGTQAGKAARPLLRRPAAALVSSRSRRDQKPISSTTSRPSSTHRVHCLPISLDT